MRHPLKYYWGSESDIIQKYDYKKVKLIPGTWVAGGRQGQQWQSLQCRRQRGAAINTSVIQERKGKKQRKTSTGKERNKGHLHWVKEEEHDEEGDRGPKGKTHRLHAVQGCHTVLPPAKYILVLDFFCCTPYICAFGFLHTLLNYWWFNLFLVGG